MKLSQRTLEEALSRHCGEIHGEAITRHILSKLFLAKGEINKAMEHIDKAINIFERLKAFRASEAILTKANICLEKRDYRKAREFMLSARDRFTELQIPHGIAETEMLEGELFYLENGDARNANLLVSRASTVFANLGFKLLENEAAQLCEKINLGRS